MRRAPVRSRFRSLIKCLHVNLTHFVLSLSLCFWLIRQPVQTRGQEAGAALQGPHCPSPAPVGPPGHTPGLAWRPAAPPRIRARARRGQWGTGLPSRFSRRGLGLGVVQAQHPALPSHCPEGGWGAGTPGTPGSAPTCCPAPPGPGRLRVQGRGLTCLPSHSAPPLSRGYTAPSPTLRPPVRPQGPKPPKAESSNMAPVLSGPPGDCSLHTPAQWPCTPQPSAPARPSKCPCPERPSR